MAKSTTRVAAVLAILCITAPALAADPKCSTGVISDEFCCAASCVTCSGVDCSKRPGGADACCGSSIQEAGLSCLTHGPPCVMPLTDAIANSPADPTCAKGIIKSESSDTQDACCAASCGKCGEEGCSDLPGGASACCATNIRSNAGSCRSHGPPCVMTPATTAKADPTCATGLRFAREPAMRNLPYGQGYSHPSRATCCAASCKTCGGIGCGDRPGGSGDCCVEDILSTGRSCSLHPPPCVLMPKLGGEACIHSNECQSKACTRGKCECAITTQNLPTGIQQVETVPCLFGRCVSPNALLKNVCRARYGEKCTLHTQCASGSCFTATGVCQCNLKADPWCKSLKGVCQSQGAGLPSKCVIKP